jgi:flagellar FliL protein
VNRPGVHSIFISAADAERKSAKRTHRRTRMSKKSLLIAVVVLLAGGGYAARQVTAAPQKEEAPPKIAGELYVLGKEFLVNLDDGRYAKLTVAIELEHLPEAEAEGEGAPPPPEGYGSLPEEAAVREVVTDVLSGADADELVELKSRERVKERMLRTLRRRTDVPVAAVLIPDVTVQ